MSAGRVIAARGHGSEASAGIARGAVASGVPIGGQGSASSPRELRARDSSVPSGSALADPHRTEKRRPGSTEQLGNAAPHPFCGPGQQTAPLRIPVRDSRQPPAIAPCRPLSTQAGPVSGAPRAADARTPSTLPAEQTPGQPNSPRMTPARGPGQGIDLAAATLHARNPPQTVALLLGLFFATQCGSPPRHHHHLRPRHAAPRWPARSVARPAGRPRDERVRGFRASAYRYAALLAATTPHGSVTDAVAPKLAGATLPWKTPRLRDYQEDALRAWRAAGSQGIAALPTGSGKTVVAIAALAETRGPALILCPTRARS